MRVRVVRFVVFQQGEQWVAQCLEYDIGAQARSLQEIQPRVAAVLECEFEERYSRYKSLFGGLGAPPNHFAALWAKRLTSYIPLRAVSMSGVRVEVAICDQPRTIKGSTTRSTLAQYCTWATSAGCSVRGHLFVGPTGYPMRVVKMAASAVNYALEIGIPDGDILAPATRARLDRRLDLRRLFGLSTQPSMRTLGN